MGIASVARVDEPALGARGAEAVLAINGRAAAVAKLASLPSRSSIGPGDKVLIADAAEILKLLTWEPTE